MEPYIEALFYCAPTPPAAEHTWQERSTQQYFVFESAFGAVRIRKRTAYPATFATTYGSKLLFGYGSLGIGQSIAQKPLPTTSEELFYDEEFLYVEADAATQTVHMQRDAYSSLPVFVGNLPGKLILGDSFAVVCNQAGVGNLQVDAIALAEVLCNVPTYDRTLCEQVKLVYDRTRLAWSARGLVFTSPPDARRMNSPKSGSDIRELRIQIEDAINSSYQRYGRGARFGCDLSGGMDSSLVTGYLASQGYDMLTASVLLEGQPGQHQLQKLRDLHGQFGFANVNKQLDHQEYYPLDFLDKLGEQPFYHYQLSAHLSAKKELYASLADQGIACVFTGHGGDELCDNIPDHAPDSNEDIAQHFMQRGSPPPPWWTPAALDYVNQANRKARPAPKRPAPLLSRTAASITANLGGVSFGYNIWPVSPLANPRLYAYCQALPMRYRYRRNLTRLYLRARGFPASIYQGPAEDFGEYYFHAVTNRLGPLLHHYMADSVLASYGLIEPKILLASFETLCSSSYSPAVDSVAFELVSMLAIEANLQILGLKL